MLQISLVVSHPSGGKATTVKAVVDTGAAHSILPASLLTGLGIEPSEQYCFTRADGSRVSYGCGSARFHIAGGEWQCPVLFGPENAFVLGRSTRAIFNLEVDPAGIRLRLVKRLPLHPGAQPPASDSTRDAAASVLQIFNEIHRNMPEGAFDGLPTDGARNYKHYLYGWPKEDEREQPPAPDGQLYPAS